MCLILLALHTHPSFKLILAANRDEYYDRPSEPPVSGKMPLIFSQVATLSRQVPGSESREKGASQRSRTTVIPRP